MARDHGNSIAIGACLLGDYPRVLRSDPVPPMLACGFDHDLPERPSEADLDAWRKAARAALLDCAAAFARGLS